MPKVSKVIRQFDGGINSFSDARDLDDKTASEIKNFSVRNVGKLKPIGFFAAVSSEVDDGALMMSSVSNEFGIHNGAVFFPFSTDKTKGGGGGGEKWIAHVNRSDGILWLHSHTTYTGSSNPWDTPDGSSFARGMVADIGTPGAEAAYYAVDGALRVCNADLGDATILNTSAASSLWFGFIDRTYIGSSCVANDWHTYPAVLVPPNATTFSATVTKTGTDTVAPSANAGQFTLNINIQRDKGDGTIQLQGRKLYATYTFDGKQETLPHELTIITSSDIEGVAPAPTAANSGYITTVSKDVAYGASSIGLDVDVRTLEDGYCEDFEHTDESNCESGHSNKWTTGNNWETSGVVVVLDEREEYQTLTYTDIIDGDDTTFDNANDSTLIGVAGWVDYGKCAQDTLGHNTKTLCDVNEDEAANHDSGTQWIPSNLTHDIAIEYDPPGELQELDENLGFNLTLGAQAASNTANGQMLAKQYGGNRITHVNIYTNKYEDDHGTVAQATDYAHVCTFDLVNGAENLDGTYTAWASSGGQQVAISEFKGSMFTDTYQGRTGVFPTTKSLDIRWKTATVLNRRIYAGNVKMQDIDGVDKAFPDRVMKSIPNRFDAFPEYDSLDVVVDDGDEIVLLESFGGALLQFKKETLYVIDVTSEPEFLRETHKYRGIPSTAAAMRTDFGVIFANKSGAFMYTNGQVKQLVSGKIEDEWKAFYDDTILVGFHPRLNLGIFAKKDSSDFLLYDMLTGSFVEGSDAARIGANDKGQFFIYDNELILPQEANNVVTFGKWDNDYSNSAASSADYSWVSKDLDLGNPATLKRVSKVKITYKTTSGYDGNAKATLLDNDGTGISNSGAGVPLSSSGTDFGDTGGEWVTQDFKPDTSIKCMSLKLKIENDGDLDVGFEVNDITIVYRERPVK